MQNRRRIKSQLYFGVVLLALIITSLSIASFQGVLKFKKLTKSIKARSLELPLAAELSFEVNQFSSTVWRTKKGRPFDSTIKDSLPSDVIPQMLFDTQKQTVESVINRYLERLTALQKELPETVTGLESINEEKEIFQKLRTSLDDIDEYVKHGDWDFGGNSFTAEIEAEIEQLQRLASSLPTLLKNRMDTFSEKARSEYRTWIFLSGILSLGAVLFMILLTRRFMASIFRPLEQLYKGTRRVAAGDHDYRIQLNSNDELEELAESFNNMTSSFQKIETDLNEKVQQRTKEVVRSEQMASVGFLAAGVAHEINNPLNTIAWAAESLESRMHEMLMDRFDGQGSLSADLLEDIKVNLRRIQDEAFRCKGITDSLLDFSRLGDTTKSSASLREVFETVVEMVRPLGKYRQRTLEFECDKDVVARVNTQEMKQVALNLITNALDCVPDGGLVQVSLSEEDNHAVLKIKDNGCGMTEEVKKHLFEPFFTRRAQGEGTGLGLSITYRIIQEHGGQIEPYSAGPNQGSTFIVRIPTVKHEQSKKHKRQAA